MLEEMRIRNIGVIEDALLELGPGLTTITGETGAGKTMLLTGLGLLCGGRADAGRVRQGSERASVEARLHLPVAHPARQVALDAGAELDGDGALLISRTVSADGRSRAHVGGRAVPNGLLARVMADVVAVHGQSTQLGLLRPARQLATLDAFAGTTSAQGEGVLASYREAYRAWREAEAELELRSAHARERAQEADMLGHGVSEIEQAAPAPNEMADLETEATRLSHADALREAAEKARTALTGAAEESGGYGAADALGLLVEAQRAMAGVESHDPRLAEFGERLRDLAAVTADLASDLASYADGVDTDPVRLDAVEQRKAALSHLTRRYGDTLDEVLAWAERARIRLTELDDSDEALAGIVARRDAEAARTTDLGEQLRARRTEAAQRLQTEVRRELDGLEMAGVGFEVSVEPCDPGPDGMDTVAFGLGDGPDGVLRPLAKGASGGELSRLMLAVEVVLARVTGCPVLVFDEADAGIGGRTAVEVGLRLAALGDHHQVLAVTHLPQVAAFADRHLVVSRTGTGRVSRSDVDVLTDRARPQELARMLAGLQDSDSARAHAEELLEAARLSRLGRTETEASSG